MLRYLRTGQLGWEAVCLDLEEVAGGPRKPELAGRSSAEEELAWGGGWEFHMESGMWLWVLDIFPHGEKAEGVGWRFWNKQGRKRHFQTPPPPDGRPTWSQTRQSVFEEASVSSWNSGILRGLGGIRWQDWRSQLRAGWGESPGCGRTWGFKSQTIWP